MSISGQCELCSTGEVEHTCGRCAKLVCDRHYDEDTGFCTECAAEFSRDEREHIPDKDDMPDDVDTYRF